jgi:hypothetical protein
MSKNSIHQTALTVGTNFAVWASGCIAIQVYNGIAKNMPMNQPMTDIDRDSLFSLIDSRAIFALLFGCFVLFGIAAIIRHKVATPETDHRAKALLDQLMLEASSLFLNSGSGLMAVAYFVGDWRFFYFALLSWGGWLLCKPSDSSTSQSDRSHA